MRAILLAAGFGTRLLPLTKHLPKCLVRINDKPLLGIWIDKIIDSGLGPVLINTHYLSGAVVDFTKHNVHNKQLNIVYEQELLGTAGTLIKNINFYQGKDGLLIHADNYCLDNLSILIKAHKNRPSGCLMTMMTFRTDQPSCCGIVEIDKRGVVIGFHEKIDSPPGNLANGAVYVLSKEMFTWLCKERSTATDFSREVLPQLLGRIFTYETNNVFIDIGNIENLEKANKTSF